MALKNELNAFLSKKGIKCVTYPLVRGSKIVEFTILSETHKKKFVDECLMETFSNRFHRLTFSESPRGTYMCNFQPLILREYKLVVPTEHCSDCVHFWSNPQVGQMYCKKMEKRITARKKPCKYFEKNT